MAVIKQVYKGDAVLTTQTSITVTLSEAVDTTKSVLLFSIRTDADDWEIPSFVVMGELTNSTTLTFSRAISDATVNVSWQVIEFSLGVTVQRGTISLSATSTNIVISSVDLTKTFAICTLKSGGWLGYSDYDYEECVRIQLTSSTNINLSITQTSGFAQTVAWQVIEYDACTVQQVNYTALSSYQTNDVTISAIDTSRTFICGSFNTTETILANNEIFNFYLLNSTTIRFIRSSTATSNQQWTVFIVQFDLNQANVFNLNVAIGAAQTAVTTIINEINLQSSFSSIKSNYSFATTGDSTDAIKFSCCTTTLLSSTEMQIYRTSSNLSGNIYCQIVEFINPIRRWHLRGISRRIFYGMC